MMIDDDDIEPGLRRARQGLEGRDAAIDGHDQCDALGLQRQQRRQIGPIAFLHAIRNVDAERPTCAGEEARQQGR